MKTIHAWITGRVQGVWFRQSTRQKAIAEGINGWVRNLPDGRVEAMLSGDEPAVDAVLEWLSSGPPNARVDEVKTRSEPYTEYEGFDVL